MEERGNTTQIYHFQWQGVTIEARYEPQKWSVVSHLEIESIEPERVPLPITPTGYKSCFLDLGSIEEQGGDVPAIVTAWLDEEAQSQEWQDHLESQRQYSMF